MKSRYLKKTTNGSISSWQLKTASSSKEVMAEFPSDDLLKDLKDLELSNDNLPLQRSLGLYWNLNTILLLSEYLVKTNL